MRYTQAFLSSYKEHLKQKIENYVKLKPHRVQDPAIRSDGPRGQSCEYQINITDVISDNL